MLLKSEYFDLHKKLKQRIKGKIYIGINHDIHTINIRGFKNIVYKMNLDDLENTFNTEDMANEIELKYREFILNRFFIRRGMKNNEEN